MKPVKIYDGGIPRFSTDCCALGQLSLVNSDSVERIKEILQFIREESSQNWYGTEGKDFGDRAIFVITTPNEEHLASKLASIGFKHVYTFPRRTGYPEGMLKMWIITL